MSKDEKWQSQNVSELLLEVQKGSSEAFVALAEMYAPLLDSETLRYKQNFCEDDFNDIKQGALIAFYRAALAYRIDGSVTFGLFAKICVVNGIADVLRFIGKKSGDVEIDDVKEADLPAEDTNPEELVLDKEQYRSFLGKVNGVLSEFENRVLRLYLLGYTYAEISVAVGKSAKSVDNALHRIKEKIKKNYSGEPL